MTIEEKRNEYRQLLNQEIKIKKQIEDSFKKGEPYVNNLNIVKADRRLLNDLLKHIETKKQEIIKEVKNIK